MAINYRDDFHAFPASLCRPLPRRLWPLQGRIDEAFFFIERTSVAKFVGNICQHLPQYLVAAPSLEASMHRFVVDSSVGAYAIARLCSESTEPLQAPDGSE
jgi:hypothetical protein